MSAVLRVYDPAECDEHGVPLDWERCRTCEGSGKVPTPDYPGGLGSHCPTCGGHGSLKAAALALRWDDLKRPTPDFPSPPIRCEGCGHPMSEGTWEGRWDEPDAVYEDERRRRLTKGQALKLALKVLSRGSEPYSTFPAHATPPVHYSPCDEGCRHGGPGRTYPSGMNADDGPGDYDLSLSGYGASWRPVDVRTLGWPHDLRPERLAVLCLRCFAERGR